MVARPGASGAGEGGAGRGGGAPAGASGDPAAATCGGGDACGPGACGGAATPAPGDGRYGCATPPAPDGGAYGRLAADGRSIRPNALPSVAASRLRPSPQASAPPAAPARAARAPAKKIVSPKDGATLLDCSKRPKAEAETFAEASCLTSSSSAIHGMAIVAPALTKARGSVPPHGMRYTAPAAHQGVRDDRRRNEKEHALRLSQKWRMPPSEPSSAARSRRAPRVSYPTRRGRGARRERRRRRASPRRSSRGRPSRTSPTPTTTSGSRSGSRPT